MKSFFGPCWRLVFALALACLASLPARAGDRRSADNSPTNEIIILSAEGIIEVSAPGPVAWIMTQTNQALFPGWRLRTRGNSRVTLRWSDQSRTTYGPFTELEILAPHAPDAEAGLHLLRGLLHFFHRDKPGRLRIQTSGGLAGIEGTEFVISVAATNGAEVTTLSVIDGLVSITNEAGGLLLASDQQAVAQPGQAPRRTAGFIAENVLQWCFYYPGILDLDDLSLGTEEQGALANSLSAYRNGDLLGALAAYPAGRQPASDTEALYHAALLLSVGNAQEAETELMALEAASPSDRIARLAVALRQLIEAVRRGPNPSTQDLLSPRTASAKSLSSELLAASYYEQSRALRETSLRDALELARRAATNSPAFGFAWARVAELEFSFGRIGPAEEALRQSLALAPSNAQALALSGFLAAARNHHREAMARFDRALRADPGLGNAWLGHGLCRIRLGDSVGGQQDLLTAAALEPRRAVLRSYLGKAYANEGDFSRASKELERAIELDPNDPTAWLYSAVLKQQENRINEAVADLEKSQDLNENRSVYRSSLLLDQDRAVRSANLAGIYRDAGMFDVGVREAARAVSYDYGNYSAHLFLAESLSQELDFSNRRYETPAEAEFLVANLLAPVNAGTLSPALSEQEYSKFFDRSRFGLLSSTEYLSRGDWRESAAQYGVFEKLSYDLDVDYISQHGQRTNNDLQLQRFSVQVKGQISPQDTIFLRARTLELEQGDLAQYYDPSFASGTVRIRERQEPILSLGYHHEWAPGSHTLFLFNWLEDVFSLTNPDQPALLAFAREGQFTAVRGLNMNEVFHNSLEIGSGELQQIWQGEKHSTILGVRYQQGDFHTKNLQDHPSEIGVAFDDPATKQDVKTRFERLSFYAYHYWRIAEPWQLFGGITYDRMTFPENIQTAPVSTKEDRLDRISPKAGLIWTPTKDSAVRFAYTRSIGGASLDQSYQIEPAQVAGFIQSYRNIIPDSVADPSAGARFETFALSLEHRLPTRTYLGLEGEILNSEVRRAAGAFLFLPFELPSAIPSGLPENLDYEEQSVFFTVNQLIGQCWSVGGRYRLSSAELEDRFVTVPNGTPTVNFSAKQAVRSALHEAELFAIYNHPSGFFAQLNAHWYSQSNRGYTPDIPGDDFWHLDMFAGYRFPRRRAELLVGVLNLTDRDYKLNPLALYSELPRARTLALRLQLNF